MRESPSPIELEIRCNTRAQFLQNVRRLQRTMHAPPRLTRRTAEVLMRGGLGDKEGPKGGKILEKERTGDEGKRGQEEAGKGGDNLGD